MQSGTTRLEMGLEKVFILSALAVLRITANKAQAAGSSGVSKKTAVLAEPVSVPVDLATVSHGYKKHGYKK